MADQQTFFPLSQVPPSEIDPEACRRLWQVLLLNEFRLLSGILICSDRHASAELAQIRRHGTLPGWWGSRDFCIVCQLAGVDAEHAMSAARRLAARLHAEGFAAKGRRSRLREAPGWEECMAAGMTLEEAAERRGVKLASAVSWARRCARGAA